MRKWQFPPKNGWKCSRCGGRMHSAGSLNAAMRLSFRPQDSKFVTWETGDVLTKAVMCRDCGVVEIIGDVNKLRRLTTDRPADQEPPLIND